jgi:flagellar biosynthetic protein FlhB
VPQSQEFLSAASLIVLVGVTAFLGPWFVRWSQTMIREGLAADISVMDNAKSFSEFLNGKIIDTMLIASPFVLVLMVTGVGASILISGPTYSPKSLEWKLENLSPIRGLKNLFSPESLVKLVFSIVKLLFIGIIIWFYIEDKLEYLSTLQWLEADKILSAIGSLILGAVIRICLGLVVIGVADLIYHKWRHIEKLKMTKQEVRDENRDTEGAPEVKSRIRRKQYEAAMKRMLQDVPKANVVLVNPTHVAVALQYDPATMKAPVVVAKGGDHLCEKIKDIARSYGVPIIRRPSLARELFASVKLGKPIPDKLFTAVAEVLALIYRLRKNR